MASPCAGETQGTVHPVEPSVLLGPDPPLVAGPEVAPPEDAPPVPEGPPELAPPDEVPPVLEVPPEDAPSVLAVPPELEPPELEELSDMLLSDVVLPENP